MKTAKRSKEMGSEMVSTFNNVGLLVILARVTLQ